MASRLPGLLFEIRDWTLSDPAHAKQVASLQTLALQRKDALLANSRPSAPRRQPQRPHTDRCMLCGLKVIGKGCRFAPNGFRRPF